MRYVVVAIMTMIIFMGSCTSPFGKPAITKRHVQIEDIAGIWQFDHTVMELHADGTFEITGSDGLSGNGQWVILQNNKHLQLYYDTQRLSAGIGYIFDTQDGSFGIWGGDFADPDYWSAMEKVGTVPQ